MEARATGEAQSHLQNAGLGAALKGPPSPLTLISLSPSMGSPGAQEKSPPHGYCSFRFLPGLSLCLENISILCKEPGPPSSAQHPLPPTKPSIPHTHFSYLSSIQGPDK